MITIIQPEEYLVDLVVEIATARKDKRGSEKSSTVEHIVKELVRLQMRSLSQEAQSKRSGAMLLNTAIHDVDVILVNALRYHEVRFDLGPYFEEARRALEPSAQELAQLAEKLRIARQEERIARKGSINMGGSARVEISEIGLSGANEGLLVRPLAKSCQLNIDGLRAQEEYEVRGDWFPFEILYGEHNFVLDDDGSLFASTENLSGRLAYEVRESLGTLSQLLYSSDEQSWEGHR